MFETPIDAWFVWVGTALAAAAILAVSLSLPTAPPPDAEDAADTVDAVAGAPHNATGEHPIDAGAVRLSPHAIALRGPGGVARDRLSFGPVTPVPESGPLARVLDGVSPGRAFDGPSALARAARQARRTETSWESTERLRVRTVVWGEIHVTLVGA